MDAEQYVNVGGRLLVGLFLTVWVRKPLLPYISAWQVPPPPPSGSSLFISTFFIFPPLDIFVIPCLVESTAFTNVSASILLLHSFSFPQ